MLELAEELISLEPWERFPDAVDDWAPEQKAARCWPPEEWAIYQAGTPGPGAMITWRPNQRACLERVKERPRQPSCIQPPGEIPESVRQVLEQSWQGISSQGVSGKFEYLRNEWEERKGVVLEVLTTLRPLLDEVINVVLRVGGDPGPLRALASDAYLYADTVASAQRVLGSSIQDLKLITSSQPRGPSKNKGHAKGTLDERAVSLAKAWQQKRPGWTLKELAKSLGSSPQALQNKYRDGRPKCPLISEFWNDVQLQKEESKMNALKRRDS
jgi:hypothetical protein